MASPRKRPAKSKPLFVTWCPKDALDGMQMLHPMEELAYRRIIDLIYDSGNKLADDGMAAWMTKTGDQWPEIRQRLIDLGKIYVRDGLIRNAKCDDSLAEIARKITRRKKISEAGVKARKARRQHVISPVVAPTVAPTVALPVHQTDNLNRLTDEPINQVEKKELTGTNTEPPLPTPSRYRFAGVVIRLNDRDYEKWREEFRAIPDLEAELRSLDEHYATLPESERLNWFHRARRALNNKHQQLLARNGQPRRRETPEAERQRKSDSDKIAILETLFPGGVPEST